MNRVELSESQWIAVETPKGRKPQSGKGISSEVVRRQDIAGICAL